MFNTKICNYGDTSQLRLYSHSLAVGDELKERKNTKDSKITAARKLEYDIYKWHNREIDELFTYSEYLKLRDFNDISSALKSQFYEKTSISRTKQTIFELSKCNKWDFFVTFTFNRTLVDSSDYDLCVKTVSQWCNNVKKRKAPNFKYVIVPELHADRIHYHFHGVFSDVGDLRLVDSGHVTDKGQIIYNCADWSFGFSTLTAVNDSDRVSFYITKYITKDLFNHTKGKHRFLSSTGLKRKNVTNLLLSDEEKMSLIASLEDINYSKTISNVWNKVNFIDYKEI